LDEKISLTWGLFLIIRHNSLKQEKL
jgi:hypothetical protein